MVWLADATKDAEMLAVDATGQVGTHHRTGRTPIAWMDRSPRDVNKKKSKLPVDRFDLHAAILLLQPLCPHAIHMHL